MSDFPQIKIPFFRDVFIQVQNMDTIERKFISEEKGIRVLSKYLSLMCEDQDKSEKPINIFLDTIMEKETRSFFEKQDYKEMRASDDSNLLFENLLHTLVLLAGKKNITNVVSKKDEADIIISFEETPDSIKIPIYRFIPVAIKDSNIYNMISKPEKDIRNFMFLTVGGPEHNKLLELFIALHRWYGGETVFNHSNYFDRERSKEIDSALLLYNEAYVGGIAKKGEEERKRTGKGAFVVTFSIPTALPWSEKPDHNDKQEFKEIKVVAIVGMSAVGTTLGAAYVTFKEKFNVGKDEITFIDIPDDIKDLRVKNADNKQNEFIKNYLYYLQNKENNIPVLLPGDVYIETLLNPVEQEFYDAMNDADIKFDELKGYESHAKLWSLIAERYLIKRY